MASYVITKNAKGKYQFVLEAKPGNEVVTSQLYMARKGALKGIRAIGKAAGKAQVEDDTKKDAVKLPIPKFVLYKTKDGKFVFEYVANNGKGVVTSKKYATAAKAKEGIKFVKANAKAKYNKYTIEI